MSLREELALRRRAPVRLNLGQLETLLAVTEAADTASWWGRRHDPGLHRIRVIIERARNRRLRAVERARGAAT